MVTKKYLYFGLKKTWIFCPKIEITMKIKRIFGAEIQIVKKYVIRFWRQNSNILGAKVGRFLDAKVEKKLKSCFDAKIHFFFLKSLI